MQEDLRIDAHKLIYHPDAVARWMRGENVYPIEIEISPSGACNHRCTFCAVDYLGYKPAYLDKEIILRDIRDISKKGLKSVVCSGEGEPLLNKDLSDIVHGIRNCGVDVAMNTNGVLLTKDFSEDCLGEFSWIRFSVASMEEESYDAIQRGRVGDLKNVKNNLIAAVKIKRDNNYKTTLGVQCLLMPENLSQIETMAKELKEIGVDYFTVKPYSQHLHSNNKKNIDYNEMLNLENMLKAFENDKFKVFFRTNAMKKMHQEKAYDVCYGMPFMTHIDSQGNIWPCIAHIGTEEFCFGNIYENTFAEIWEGEKRRKVTNMLAELDINKVCREACRLDEINKYLCELKNPGGHVNFI